MAVVEGPRLDLKVKGEGSVKHRRGHLLKDQLELVKIKTPDGGTRYNIKPLPSELTFDKGLFVFVRAVQLLTSHNKDVVVVGLAGPSGAGKTAFARKIHALIPDAALLSMDNYNDGSKVIDGNFDDPRITDFDTLLSNLADLKAGRPAQVPIYDFKQSRRVGYTTVDVPASRLIILEGIYALSHRVRPLLDLRVSITGGVHFDLVKRVLRDIDRSGQAPEDIIQQISDTVHPMYKAFIEPDLKAAHLRIYNPFNPFSGFMHPTYILKSAQPVAEDKILRVLGAGAARKTESEIYDIYLVPPGEDPETCQSWLRMRYRDGRYSLMFEEWVVEGHFIISPRVTFEVPVRILGGLMALGYEIGTIMQRTSESYTSDCLMLPRSSAVGREHSAKGFTMNSEVTEKLPDADVDKCSHDGVNSNGNEVRTSVETDGESNHEEDAASDSDSSSMSLTKCKSPVTVKLDHILGMNRCFIQVQGKDRALVAAVASALGLKGDFIPHSYIEVVQLENLTQSFQTVTEDLKRRFAVNGEPLIDEHVVGSFSRGSSPLVNSFTRTTGFALSSPMRSRVVAGASINASTSGGNAGSFGTPLLSSSAPPTSASAPIPVRLNTPVAQRSGLLSQRINALAGSGSGSSLAETGQAPLAGNATPIDRRRRGSAGSASSGSPPSGSRSASTPDTAGRRASPGGAGSSRPSSPAGNGVDAQVRKLVQSQALLTSKMEELTMQLKLVSAWLPQNETPVTAMGSSWLTGTAWAQWAAPLSVAGAGALVGAAVAAVLLVGKK